MKKPEWIFVIALLLVGAFFSYRYFTKSEKFNPLQLVPTSAVAVYEVTDPFAAYAKLKNAELWKGLGSITQVKLAEQALNIFDSLILTNNKIRKSLVSGRSIISLHVTGNETTGLMIYLPTGPGTSVLLENVLAQTTGSTVTRQTRVYDDYTINEIRSGNKTYTYILYDNYIVFSSYGYLIEDVVRNINDSFQDGLFVDHSNLYAVPKLDDDAGNIYLNGSQLTPLANTFLPPLSTIRTTLAQSGYLDLTVSSTKLFFSGFFFDRDQTGFTSIFKNQEAGTPETINLVSDNAAEVTLINVNDLQGWHSQWKNTFQTSLTYDNSLLQFIKGDFVLSTFYNNAEKNDKLLIARLIDKEGAVNLLNRKAESLAKAKQDTVYYEQYADLEIGLIEEGDYLSSFLGSPFSGFPVTYFTVYENYLVLSTSTERIKHWLDDIEADLIWSRSVEKSEFISVNLNETSYAQIYSNPWGWSLHKDSFNDKTNTWWAQNEQPMKQFGMLSFQFANLDNRYYTEIKLEYNPQQVYSEQQELSDELLTQLTGKLITKPQLVRNHNNSQWEVLMQDSSTFISLLDDQGELLWTDSLGQQIKTTIYQVDYYKNRKLQYLFATDSMIHIIDRNGISIEGYPKNLGDVRLKDLYLLDYDKSRNYRFLLTDYSGNLYMLNKEGEQLEGWDPLSIKSELSDQVFHVRVRGNDRIIIGQSNGTIEVRNRRSELQQGFPIDLGFNLENPLHFKTGSTFENSRFTTVSKEGILVEIDLNGREYTRQQVGEPSSSANFSIAIDKARNDMVITRQDLNRLTILKKDGETILEKDFDSNGKKEVQYYYLGVDKRLYIVRDTENGQLFIYNKLGSLVNESSLFSDYPVSVVYRKKQSKCYIYTSINQSVEIKSFTF